MDRSSIYYKQVQLLMQVLPFDLYLISASLIASLYRATSLTRPEAVFPLDTSVRNRSSWVGTMFQFLNWLWPPAVRGCRLG